MAEGAAAVAGGDAGATEGAGGSGAGAAAGGEVPHATHATQTRSVAKADAVARVAVSLLSPPSSALASVPAVAAAAPLVPAGVVAAFVAGAP